MKTIRARSPAIRVASTAGSRTSPQISRCAPSCQTSPRRTRAGAASGEDVVGRVIRLLGGDGRQEGVDLRNREAGDPNLKVKVLSQERPQFRGEPVLVPAGIECQFVVGENIGALLGLAQVRELQTGDRGQTQLGGCSHAAVASQDRPRLVDQHRRGEAELPDASRRSVGSASWNECGHCGPTG